MRRIFGKGHVKRSDRPRKGHYAHQRKTSPRGKRKGR